MKLPEHKDTDGYGEKDVCQKCPVCEKKTNNLALNNWLETYETCDCKKYGDKHLVKVTWHRDCFSYFTSP